MKTKRINDKGGGIITTTLLAGGLWLASATLSVFAADFTVNTTADAVDVNPGDGICEVTATVGDCTLRAAVMEANALAGADTITLPAGLYTLTITGIDENPSAGEPWEAVIDSNASIGDLDITQDVTITGAGPGNDPATSTIVQWGVTPPGFLTTPTNHDPTLDGRNDRIFHIRAVDANIANVTLSGMTLLNGDVGLIPSSATDVCVEDADPATPGVYHPELENAYDLAHTGTCANLDDPNAEPNLVITQFRRMGGAIAIGEGAAIVDYEQAIHGPVPGGGGGGGGGNRPPVLPPPEDESAVSVESVTYDQLVIVSNWSGADAGGIFNIAAGTLSQSAISGNFSGGNGGGLYNDADLTISGSLIGKVFDADTLALYPQLGNGNQGENGGGMFYTGVGTINIVGSAVNGNQGIGGGGIAGRAMGVLWIKNSTLSGNIGSDVGGGITTNGEVYLYNATVADNLATTDAPGGGAGLNAFGPGHYHFNNTVLVNNWVEGEGGNRLANCGCSGGEADCPADVMISGFYNIENGDTCDLSLASGTDLPNTDPLLGALALNGGLTETHALPSDSPAVDQGFQSLCNQLAVEAWGAFDQRGDPNARTEDGNDDGVSVCDMGAFEFARAVVPPVTPPSTGGGSSGGLCSYDPNGRFDPVLPLLVMLSLIYLAWRRRVATQ
jgi:CSLREA domain-containing protein